MSDGLKAWYLFLGLTILTLLSIALEDTEHGKENRAPYALSSAVALPHNIPYQVSKNIRDVLMSALERENYREQLKELTEQNALLAQEIRQLEIKLDRYKRTLDVRVFQTPAARLTSSVTGIEADALGFTLTLGSGSRDGVVRDMPVTVPQGLIGIVTDVETNKASVRAVVDGKSRIGVSVRSKGGQGTARGEARGLIRVTDYYVDKPIRKGDIVETHSLGGLYPRGILVGEVIEIVEPHDNQLELEFLVKPAVDLHNVLEVALIEPLL